jgi:predicted DNA-binding antitoxin AbrB/MazE fold protein
MGEIAAIYEGGVLRIVNPAKLETGVLTVRILNRDEMLMEEDMRDILEAQEDREKGKFYKLEDAFERGMIEWLIKKME